MATWLDLVSDGEGWSLIDTGRLHEVVQGMTHPKSQYPLLLYFAGNSSRLRALRALFPRNNVTRKGPAGLARLHLSTVTSKKEQPVIFAETDIFTQNGLGDTVLPRYPFTGLRRFQIPVPEKSASIAEVKWQIIGRNILPWTRVFCLFVNSTSEMETAQSLLQAPRRRLTVGNQPLPESMHVIIVLTEDDDGHNSKPNDCCLKMAEGSLQPNQTILDLRRRSGLSELVVFEPLRRLIMDQLYEMHTIEQTGHNVLFSAMHLNALWSAGLQLQEYWPKQRDFDCLRIARESFPEDIALSKCLVELKKKIESSPCPDSELYKFVASALLMDAYPPGMHRFPPDLVFKANYEKHCLVAFPALESTDHCQGIMSEFSQEFKKLRPHHASAALRLRSLRGFHADWSDLRSTKTCFACLCRPPEHMMPCNHAICENCTVVFGERWAEAEYQTSVGILAILQFGNFRQQNNLLDGGGVRGIIQLGLLRELERRLGGIPLAQIADLCSGTSVGALSTIDMILNGSPAALSFSRFPALAQAIFKSSFGGHSRFPMIRGIQLVILATKMLTGGQYDSANLIAVLKEAYLMSRPQKRQIAKWLSSQAELRTGKHVYSGTTGGNLNVLKIVPTNFYFQRTINTIPSCGKHGGVRANNPLAIALKEPNKIWPKAKSHDLLLSIGTGVSSSDCYSVPDAPNVLRDGSIFRLIRATLSSPCMDGEQGFAEALNYLPSDTKSDIFRLNQVIDDPLPRLDEVEKIALETTRSRLQKSKERNRLSLPHVKEEKLNQRIQQESENDFYRSCFENFRDLATAAIEAIDELELQYHFEPEAEPIGNNNLQKSLDTLRTILENSKNREAKAEHQWKQKWNISRMCKPACRWL
ncbi:hypothetical protein N7532_011821 [Penicillium argentinense]|uniref:PNPLA domain-containing protein n=1 Tax=Penicillium argentinense TaxID=1131581 RepID=A0A9W9EJ75_9EURO|nr:uncharacterized protein N7532_011821 [Penicillium argentinense]KAJ5082778.1 hypothetical protein N7532_011821 [Penicillium argentinense]